MSWNMRGNQTYVRFCKKSLCISRIELGSLLCCYYHITYLKGCLLKNLNITRLHEMAVRDVDLVDQRWNTFITGLRNGNNTEKGSYILWEPFEHFIIIICVICLRNHKSICIMTWLWMNNNLVAHVCNLLFKEIFK